MLYLTKLVHGPQPHSLDIRLISLERKQNSYITIMGIQRRTRIGEFTYILSRRRSYFRKT